MPWQGSQRNKQCRQVLTVLTAADRVLNVTVLNGFSGAMRCVTQRKTRHSSRQASLNTITSTRITPALVGILSFAMQTNIVCMFVCLSIRLSVCLIVCLARLSIRLSGKILVKKLACLNCANCRQHDYHQCGNTAMCGAL